MKGMKVMNGIKPRKVKVLKLNEIEKEKFERYVWYVNNKRHLNEDRKRREIREAKEYTVDYNLRNEIIGTEKEIKNVLGSEDKKYYQVNKGLRHLMFNRAIEDVYYLEKDIKTEIPDKKNELIFLYENGILRNIEVKRYNEKGGFNRVKVKCGKTYEEFYIKPISLNDVSETFIMNHKEFRKEVLKNYMEETGRRIYVKA